MRAVVVSSPLKALKADKPKIKKFVALLDAHFAADEGQLAINFVSHSTLAQMHGDFCGDPTPTDIITFPFEGEAGLWGELYISPQAAVEFVLKRNPQLIKNGLRLSPKALLALAPMILETAAGSRAHASAAYKDIREERSTAATPSGAKSIALGAKVDEELRRYIIHGYLHLMGYDDLTPKGRAQMRRLERVGLEKTKAIKKIFSLRVKNG